MSRASASLIRMIRGFIAMIAAQAVLLVTTQAQAELNLSNRTSFRMEAAVGIEKRANVMTRGWYRLNPGQCRQVMDGPLDADMVCLHARAPFVYGAANVRGGPYRLYSYAEAIDASGRPVNRGDVPLAWGGTVALCTRDGRFELAEHKDCATRGLNSAGFAVIDLAGKPSTTVRFKEP